jgi:hypothetical protein
LRPCVAAALPSRQHGLLRCHFFDAVLYLLVVLNALAALSPLLHLALLSSGSQIATCDVPLTSAATLLYFTSSVITLTRACSLRGGFTSSASCVLSTLAYNKSRSSPLDVPFTSADTPLYFTSLLSHVTSVSSLRSGSTLCATCGLPPSFLRLPSFTLLRPFVADVDSIALAAASVLAAFTSPLPHSAKIHLPSPALASVAHFRSLRLVAPSCRACRALPSPRVHAPPGRACGLHLEPRPQLYVRLGAWHGACAFLVSPFRRLFPSPCQP